MIMNKIFNLFDTILDTFSDRYHCKKCIEKLGCGYCKAYGGHIANNKYNTGDIVDKARQKYYNSINNSNTDIDKLTGNGKKLEDGEIIPFEQPKLCENDVFKTLKERTNEIRRKRGLL
jgi:hypothetical protein